MKPRKVGRPESRAEAREAILWYANAQRRRHMRQDGYRFLLPPLTARHLHQAVAIVRHQGLVADGLLELAGFRPRRNRGAAA